MSLGAAASADTMPVDPTNPATPPTVDGSVLPTTQMDGAAWAQAVVGNTVYVAGTFTAARRSGSPAGSYTTPRTTFLAYDITTGVLNSSLDVPLNGRALAVAASPDGSRVYLGGDFTTAGGGNYFRIANWQVSTTDSTAALQAAGNVGLKAYLSGTASPSPVTVKFANCGVVAVP